MEEQTQSMEGQNERSRVQPSPKKSRMVAQEVPLP